MREPANPEPGSDDKAVSGRGQTMFHAKHIPAAMFVFLATLLSVTSVEAGVRRPDAPDTTSMAEVVRGTQRTSGTGQDCEDIEDVGDV